MTRTFRVTYEPDPEVDELLNEILAEMPEVVEVGRCKWKVKDNIIKPACCSMWLHDSLMRSQNYIYCPFCGAKIERI